MDTTTENPAAPPALQPAETDKGAARGASRPGDRVFIGLSRGSGIFVLVLMAAIAAFLTYRAVLALSKNEANFFTTMEWNPSGVPPQFGIAVLAFGTIVSSVIAMAIAVPIAVGIALFITHYAPRKLGGTIAYVIDLLAAVPSIVYGLWGALVLVPHLNGLYGWLDDYFGWTGLFAWDGGPARSLFTVGILLAIMILPIITNVSREVFRQVPRMHEEAALALGATRWEVIRMSVLPFGRSGIISASMLGLGRALGETMAVAMGLLPDLHHPGQPARRGRRHLRPEHRQQVQRGHRDGPGRADRLRSRPLRHHPAGQRRGPADHRPPQGVLGGQRMSNASLTDKRPPSSLRGATLPKWFAWAVAAGAVLLGLGIGFAAGLDSSIQWALIAAVLFVAGSYGISAKVEGPRQAKDRVATSLVWVAFLMAIVPLASLAWTTVKRGIKVFDGYFLTHSMGVVADTEPGGGIYHAILGTAEQVGLATLISVPIGVLTASHRRTCPATASARRRSSPRPGSGPRSPRHWR
ncbi:hypothetical protein SFUMM280S_10110 [Streptomyces fumanus]